MIYADHASTAPLSKQAQRVVFELTEEFGNPSSPHAMGASAQKIIINARNEIKELIGANESDTLIFTSGGSEANAQALFSALAFKKKRLIISAIEHDSVFNSAKALERFGLTTDVADADRSGTVLPEAIEKLIDGATATVSVMTANNEIGTIQPISSIGAICRERGIAFHTDAVQAVGHIPLCFKTMNADMLSLSAHKFGGMKGVGALCVRNGARVLPIINGGMQENGLRAGTENVIGIAAMAAALKEALANSEEKQSKTEKLRKHLIGGLSEIDGVLFNGSAENSLSGIINVSFPSINSDAMLMMLDSFGICASSGAACRSAEGTPSRVLAAIGLSRERIDSAVRFSFSNENTVDEIDFIIKAVRRILNEK